MFTKFSLNEPYINNKYTYTQTHIYIILGLKHNISVAYLVRDGWQARFQPDSLNLIRDNWQKEGKCTFYLYIHVFNFY